MDFEGKKSYLAFGAVPVLFVLLILILFQEY